MNSIRAYHIVKLIASCGIAHAEALYGREVCNEARFTMRADVAQRQASKARHAGAFDKRSARCAATLARPWNVWGKVSRQFERDSRRAYRAAAGYDQVAQVATKRAEVFQYLAQCDAAVPTYFPARERFSHMPTA